MQPDLHEVTVSNLIKELGLSRVATETESLVDAKLSPQHGLVRGFVSPHEAIASWGCGARVHVDAAVKLSSDVLNPMVAELAREGNRHVFVCTASKSEKLIGLDGVAREGVDALTHTFTTILPIEGSQEVLLLVLPEESPRVQAFSIAYRDSALPVCCEVTPDSQAITNRNVGRLFDEVQRLHAAEVAQRTVSQELAQYAVGWQACATDLTAREVVCRDRIESALTESSKGGRSAAELERLEQSMRELELLARVAREAAAEIQRQSAENEMRVEGKRQAAALRRGRLSRPLGAKALSGSRRSTEHRKRFASAELEQAFAAIEAELLERTGPKHQGRDFVAVAIAGELRQLSRFESSLAEGALPLSLSSLVEREVGFEQARLKHAREIGKADPALALRAVEETRERLSLLKQIVDLARWLEADEVIEVQSEAANLDALQRAANSEASELHSAVTKVLNSATSDEVRRGLQDFAAAYRPWGPGSKVSTD